MTYYKYAERTADQFIDWRQIGKSISDTIQEQSKLREEKKGTLDKEFRETMKAVVDSPQGSDNDANSWALGVANNAAEYLRTINQELKAGRMSPKDFTVARQNVSDDVNGLYNQMKSYQEWHKGRLARIQSGKASGFEGALNAEAEAVANLKSTSAYIDPMTGSVYFAKTGEDGKADRNSLLSAKNMFKITNTQVDRYDLNTELAKMGKSFAPFKRVIRAGGVQTKEDATLRKGFEEVRNGTFGAILDNPFAAASILTDNGLEGYTYTKGEPKSDKEIKIVSTSNGFQPELTDTQRKAAMDFMERQLSVYLPYEETPMPQPTGKTTGDQDKPTKEQLAALASAKAIYGGTPAQQNAAVSRLKAKDKTISDVRITNDAIEIIRKKVEGGKTVIDVQAIPKGQSLQEFIEAGGGDIFGGGTLVGSSLVAQETVKPSGPNRPYSGKPTSEALEQSFEDGKLNTNNKESVKAGFGSLASALKKQFGLNYTLTEKDGSITITESNTGKKVTKQVPSGLYRGIPFTDTYGDYVRNALIELNATIQ
jgi:hypothetical protein